MASKLFSRFLRLSPFQIIGSRPIRRHAYLEVETLEDRTLFSATPIVVVTAPTTAFINEAFSLQVSFRNQDQAPVGVNPIGYAPYVEVNLGSGVNAAAMTASYLGTPVSLTIVTYNAAGAPSIATHPLTGQPIANDPSRANESLAIVELPFGSFTETQPAATIQFSGAVMKNDPAILGVNQDIIAQGFFRLGRDPLDNPATDPPVAGPTNNDSITPTVFNVTKVIATPEGETATGANFPRTYTIAVDVANGQTLTNLQILDLLPNTLVYIGGSLTTTGAPTVNSQPVAGAPQNAPNNRLEVTYGSVTGTLSATDAVITFQVYVPEFDANGNRIIPLDGSAEPITSNNVQGTATYAGNVLTDVGQPDNTAVFTAKPLALQKTVTIAADNGAAGVGPTDIAEFALNFQVSDYFTYGNLSIVDTMADGLRLDTSFVPTFTLTDAQGNLVGTFTLPAIGGPPGVYSSSNLSVDTTQILGTPIPSTGDGSETLTFNVSQLMAQLGRPGGIMTGNRFAPGATATVRYRAVIQDTYSDAYQSGDSLAIVPGDTLANTATITGSVRSNAVPSTVLNPSESDSTAASIDIARSNIAKSIYAVNGTPIGAGPLQIAPNDTITYHLEFTISTSDINTLLITDYLPLPIFDLADFDLAWSSGVIASGAAAPPVNTIQRYFDDTYSTAGGPGISEVPGNAFVLNYGTNSDVANPTQKISVLFTIRVSTDPFADSLLLTNQVQQTANNTPGVSQATDAIIQIILAEPKLSVVKGVVGENGAGQTFGTATFTAPDLNNVNTFTGGPLTTADVAAIGASNLTTGIDGGDRVRFAAIITNDGRANAYDVQLQDTVPPGYLNPGNAAAMNVVVSRGNGVVLVPNVDYTTTFVAGTLQVQLNDNGGVGGLGFGKNPDGSAVTDGSNILVITYELVVDAADNTNATVTNTATLTNYAGAEGAVNHIPGGLSDSATVRLTAPVLTKTLGGTEINSVAQNNVANQAVIGELVTYTVTLALPEGTTPAAFIRDTLDNGPADPRLAFVGITNVTASAGLSSSIPLTVAGIGANTTLTAGSNGTLVNFGLGNITNSNTDNAASETLTITYQAVVLDVPANTTGQALNNSAQFSAQFTNPAGGPTTGYSGTIVSAANVTVIQPAVSIAKLVDVNPGGVPNFVASDTGDAGDPLRYQITLTNPASSTVAYDLTVADTLPAFITGASIFGVTATGFTTAPTAGDFQIVGGVLSIDPAGPLGGNIDMPVNSTIVIVLAGTLSPAVTIAQTIGNTASTTWTSLDGTVTDRAGANAVDDNERTYSATTPAPANIVVPAATLVKSVVSTSEASTAGNNVTVGEVVRFQLRAQIPEGTALNTILVDNLPNGFTFLDDGTATVTLTANNGFDSTNPVGATLVIGLGTGLTGTIALGDANIGSTNSLTTDPDTYNSGTDIFFKLGNLVNTDSDADPEFITIQFNAIVNNDPARSNNNNTGGGNDAGDTNNNTFTLTATSVPSQTSGNVTITVVEPRLINFAKTVNPLSGDAGDTFNYSLTFAAGNAATDSNAYDVRISDALPATVTLNTASVQVFRNGTLLTAGVDYTNATAGNNVDFTINVVNKNDAIEIRYSVVSLITNAPGTLVTNTYTATYTSLPGTNGTGNAAPGAPGTFLGERTGAGGVNDYTGTASSTFILDQQVLSKSITATSESFTPETDPNRPTAIGEVVTYRLVTTVPESTILNSQIVDALPVGMTYVTGSARIVFVADTPANFTLDPAFGGATVGGDDTTIASITPTFVIPNGNVSAPAGSGGALTFSLGNIVNQESDADREYVVIEFQALVDNSVAGSNNAGDIRTNTYGVRINGVNPGTVSNAVTTRVVEPSITDVAKTANVTSGDAGDAVRYTVQFSNTAGVNSAPAFDVIVADTLPASMTLTAGSITVFRNGALQAAGFAIDSSIPNRVFVTLDQVNPGDVIRVEYDATVANTVNPGLAITNTAIVTYTSLPGTNGTSAPGVPGSDTGERTGNGTSLNTYTDSDTETFNVNTTFQLTKTAIAGPYTIGQTVPYTLTLRMVEGVTNNVRIVDTLPPGFRFEAGSLSFTNAAGLTTTLQTVSQAGQVVTFDFGTVTNLPGAGADTITVAFNATVTDVIANQGGNAKNNTATASATGVTNSTGSASVNLAEPQLSFTKTLITSGVDAGDPVRYRITVTNASGAAISTAYDIVLSDPISANLTNATAAIFSGPAAITGQSFTGGVLTVNLDQLAAGQTAQIDVTADIIAAAPAGATIGNSVTGTYTSTPGVNPDERTGAGGVDDYTGSATAANLTLARPTIDKQAPADTTYAIGELVSYDIVVTLPEGVTQNLVVTDDLPAGMAFTGFSIINVNGITNGSGLAPVGFVPPTLDGQDAVFTFGNVTTPVAPAANTFVIRLVAQVNNVIGNQNGTTLVNNASLTYLDGTTGNQTVADPTPVTISVVEPVLTLDKTALTAATGLQAGDTVQYQITLSNLAANGATAAAFDTLLLDAVPSGLLITSIDGVAPSAGVTTDAAVAITGGGTGLSGQFDLPIDGVVVITYTATLQSNIVPLQTLINTATATFTSLNGGNSVAPDLGERFGVAPNLQGDGSLNDYRLQDTANVSTASFLSLDKSTPAPTAHQIGDAVSYQLVVGIFQGTTQNLSITDAMPASLDYIAGSLAVTFGNAGMTSTLNPTTNTVFVAGTLSFTFGDLANPADGNLTNDTITITYQARIRNTAANNNGDVKTNTATATGTNLTPASDTASVTLIEPQLTIDKTVSDTTPHLGQTVTYTLTITHAAASAADAFDLAVSDALPAGLTLVAGSLQVVSAPGYAAFIGTSLGNNASGTINRLNLGDTIVLSYQATVSANPAIIGGSFGGGDDTIANTANLGYDTQSVPNPDERTYTTNDTQIVTIVGPDLAVTKTDNVATVTPGGQTSYTIVVTNVGTDTATNVIVTDSLPPLGATYNAVLSTPGGILVGNTLTYTLPSLAVGGSATFTVTLDIAAVVPAGLNQLLNGVTVSHDDIDPTPLNNSANDIDTLNAAPDLVAAKDDGLASVVPGQVFTYTLTTRNVGNQDATGVVLTDTLPPNTTFVAASDGGTLSGNTVTWAIGSIAGGNTQTVTRTVTVRLNNSVPAGVVSLTNTAVVADDGTNGPDPTPGDNTATDTDRLPATPDLVVAKTDGVPVASPGQFLVYTITVQNVGNQDATGVVVSDTIPSLTTFVAASDGGTFSNGVVTYPAFNLAAGATATRQVTVQMTQTIPQGTANITNTVTATDDGTNGPDPTPTNNSASDIDSVGPDLQLIKVVSPTNVYVGRNVTFTFILNNLGPTAATGVVVNDPFPAGLKFISAGVPSRGAFDPASNTWFVGTMQPNTTETLSITARVFDVGPIVNRATTGLVEIDPNLSNNIDSASVNGVLRPPEFISKRLFLSTPVFEDDLPGRSTIPASPPAAPTQVVAGLTPPNAIVGLIAPQSELISVPGFVAQNVANSFGAAAETPGSFVLASRNFGTPGNVAEPLGDVAIAPAAVLDFEFAGLTNEPWQLETKVEGWSFDFELPMAIELFQEGIEIRRDTADLDGVFADKHERWQTWDAIFDDEADAVEVFGQNVLDEVGIPPLLSMESEPSPVAAGLIVAPLLLAVMAEKPIFTAKPMADVRRRKAGPM